MNPRKLKPYFEGHQKKIRMNDVEQYRMGLYTYEAVSVAVSNMFRKKGQKPNNYREKPILQEYDEKIKSNQPLSEEEKKRQTELLFANLRIMQANFENNNKEKTT